MIDQKPTAGASSPILAYLQLIRLPAVFTAMADIFLGYLLAHGSLRPALDFSLLLLASSCLYMSGMLWNDIFDRRIDAEERPGRPIPSGRVPLIAAIRLGVLLMGAGVGAAVAVGPSSALIAGLIVLAIFAYDGLLKKTPLGPLAMGSCRFFNVMLGASTGVVVWSKPQLGVALALGVYIVGVTWFARSEANTGSRKRFEAIVGMVLVNAGVMLLAAFVMTSTGRGESTSVVMLLAVIALVINRRLSAALFDPAPQKIGLAIKTMLLSLPIIDAGIVLFVTGQVNFSLAVAGLLVPAMLLSRRIAVT